MIPNLKNTFSFIYLHRKMTESAIMPPIVGSGYQLKDEWNAGVKFRSP